MEAPLQTLPTVLVVDKHRAFAQSLCAVVGNLGDSATVSATTTAEALDLGARLSPDVAIVDLDLSPNCALVNGLRASAPDTRIIVMADNTAGHRESIIKALEAGAVGAIYKEASLEEFENAFARSTHEHPVVPGDAAGLLLNAYIGALREKRMRDLATIEALAGAVEARDACTGAHLHRTTQLAQSCLERIDPVLAQNEEVNYGFMLHDVGKIGVPDGVLQKPGPLTDEEWVVMRSHPEMGVRIVEPMGFSHTAIEIILSHHERWDGGGYPNRLRRDEIPLAARSFSVVDAYDAMTSDRPYRSAMSSSDALEVVASESGAAFDPDVVDIFVDLVKESC
jgi:response regulator RpfG family c-di-GMP phosphodiesterase